METTYSYTEWAAQQRRELGAGLDRAAKVSALLAVALDTLASIAARQRTDVTLRARDAREQFVARMEAI